MNLDEIRDRFDRSKFEEAYHLIKLNQKPQFEVQVFESLVLEELEEFAGSYKLAKKLLRNAENDYQMYLANIACANVLYRRGRYEELETYLKKIHPNYFDGNRAHNGSPFWQMKAFELLGMYNHITGNLEDAYDHYIRGLELATVLQSSQITDWYINLGEIQVDRENYDSAFDYFARGLQSATETNNIVSIAYSHYNIGRILLTQGKINHAMDHFDSALDRFRTSQKISGQIISLVEIGSIQIRQGQYDLTRNLYNEAASLADELETPYYHALVSHHIGLLYFAEGDIDFGITQYQIALDVWRDVGNDVEIMRVLFELIDTLIQEDRIDIATKYLEEMAQLCDTSSIESIQWKYDFLKSMILKKGKRLKSKVEAQITLENLLEEDVKQSSLRVKILLNLLEIKLFELKTFDDEEIREELYQIIDELWTLAETENLLPLQIDILIIKSRLELILQNFVKVTQYLEQAKEIGTKLHTPYHTNRIQEMHEAISQEMIKWKKLVENHPTLKERIDRSQVVDYLQDVSKALRDYK